MTHYQLVGAELSYYSGKLRAYFRVKGIPYEEVLSTREVYQKVILPRAKVNFIPILVNGNDVIQDTSDIVDYLEARHPQPSIYPATPKQRFVSGLFELFADEFFVLQAMHYRWSFPEQYPFIYYEFGGISRPDLPYAEQVQFGESVSSKFRGSLPFLGVTEQSIPGVERFFLDFLKYFNAHLEKHQFLLGDVPCLGDVAIMGPLYAHLGRDPVPSSLIKIKAPKVSEWLEKMNGLLDSRLDRHVITDDGRILPSQKKRQFLPNDQIPETLLPLLDMILLDLFSSLSGAARVFLQEQSNGSLAEKIPRVLAFHRFTIGGVEEERGTQPFSLWKFQKLKNYYTSGVLVGAHSELSSTAPPDVSDQERKKAIDELLGSLKHGKAFYDESLWKVPALCRRNHILQFYSPSAKL